MLSDSILAPGKNTFFLKYSENHLFNNPVKICVGAGGTHQPGCKFHLSPHVKIRTFSFFGYALHFPGHRKDFTGDSCGHLEGRFSGPADLNSFKQAT